MLKVNLLILTLVLASVGAYAQDEWHTLSPPDASFTAEFPGRFGHEQQTLDTEFGQVISQVYVAQKSGTAYVINYTDYQPGKLDAVDPKVLLDGARDGAMESAQGTITAEKDIMLGGNPGRELAMSVAGGKVSTLTRFVLVGNRMYMLTAAGPNVSSSEPSVKRFLNSFKIN